MEFKNILRGDEYTVIDTYGRPFRQSDISISNGMIAIAILTDLIEDGVIEDIEVSVNEETMMLSEILNHRILPEK